MRKRGNLCVQMDVERKVDYYLGIDISKCMEKDFFF